MQIIVNGEQRKVLDGLTAEQLVKDMDIVGKRIAMEVNLEIVPRSEYTEFTFKDGDKVEIVLGFYVVNPKVLKKLNLQDDKELSKFTVLKGQHFSVE